MAQCAAKAKGTGERCKRSALPGKRVCALHGGKSPGAPKGSKYRLQTGKHEAISPETMTPDEIDYAKASTSDQISVYTEQLMILRVREYRIMGRIKKTLDDEKKAGQETTDGKRHPSSVILGGHQTITRNPLGEETISRTVNNETFVMHMLRLEDALSAVQDQIRRAVNNIAKATADSAGGRTKVFYDMKELLEEKSIIAVNKLEGNPNG